MISIQHPFIIHALSLTLWTLAQMDDLDYLHLLRIRVKRVTRPKIAG